MTTVISVTVAFSMVVHKISNLPLLMGQPMDLVFFISSIVSRERSKKTLFPGQSPGLPLVTIIVGEDGLLKMGNVQKFAFCHHYGI